MVVLVVLAGNIFKGECDLRLGAMRFANNIEQVIVVDSRAWAGNTFWLNMICWGFYYCKA